ncbi:DUF6402 family protein [Pseudomonas syringae]|uniref:DUF6402 family protein n=1 Tax=Pseudomonas syringae TaxID=317 RepID=UPI003AFA6950
MFTIKLFSTNKKRHHATTKNYFNIEYIGFYTRDHYDFNGLQQLGTWTDSSDGEPPRW